MDSQLPPAGVQNQQLRFSREVDSLAPKPGRDLGSITFYNNGESVLLRVIEGAPRDAMSFRGVATNFDRTRVLNFHLWGSFVDLLEDLPYSPYDTETEIEYHDFSIEPATPIPPSFSFITKAKVIYTRVASERGLDPDGALIRMTPKSGTEIMAYVSGIKRGWCPIATVAAVAFVVSAVVIITHRNPVVDFKVKVKVGLAEADINVKTGPGPATGHPV